MSSTMLILAAICFIAATVCVTASPPSPASLLALVAMPSVTLALSLFCVIEADIVSIDAVVSSTDDGLLAGRLRQALRGGAHLVGRAGQGVGRGAHLVDDRGQLVAAGVGVVLDLVEHAARSRA